MVAHVSILPQGWSPAVSSFRIRDVRPLDILDTLFAHLDAPTPLETFRFLRLPHPRTGECDIMYSMQYNDDVL